MIQSVFLFPLISYKVSYTFRDSFRSRTRRVGAGQRSGNDISAVRCATDAARLGCQRFLFLFDYYPGHVAILSQLLGYAFCSKSARASTYLLCIFLQFNLTIHFGSISVPLIGSYDLLLCAFPLLIESVSLRRVERKVERVARSYSRLIPRLVFTLIKK